MLDPEIHLIWFGGLILCLIVWHLKHRKNR